jgi:3-oxoacyl-[acyl-carrier protein] reductase
MSLVDKTVILTGVSRGIGLAAANALTDAGARVFGVARTAPDSSELASDVTILRADVRDRKQVDQVVSTVLKDSGRIDILINNAGIEIVKPLVDTTDEDYDQMLDVNLKGAFYFITAVLPTMQQQRTGHLIFVNSVSGIRGFTDDAVYCASKHGLTGFADALDEELRVKGIRVTTIHPGATDTTLAYKSWSPPDDPQRPHFLAARDVAEAIVYAASQPPHVVVRQMIIQPMIEPPHSPFLPLDIIEELAMAARKSGLESQS